MNRMNMLQQHHGGDEAMFGGGDRSAAQRHWSFGEPGAGRFEWPKYSNTGQTSVLYAILQVHPSIIFPTMEVKCTQSPAPFHSIHFFIAIPTDRAASPPNEQANKRQYKTDEILNERYKRGIQWVLACSQRRTWFCY
jgi:hypothetical protein